MTFKELKIGDFFIPFKRSRFCSKYGTSLLKKTGNGEIHSMVCGMPFPVYGDSVIRQDQSVIKVTIDKAIVEKYG